MRGCGPQFTDHMRAVSRGRLQISSIASEVDRLKKSRGHKYALLVAHGPPSITGSVGSVVKPLLCWNVGGFDTSVLGLRSDVTKTPKSFSSITSCNCLSAPWSDIM